MKTHTIYLLSFLSFLSAFWMGAGAVPPRKPMASADAKPLKIVFDNDVHGSIDRYASLAGFRDELREAGYPVLTVSVGDYLQGSAYAAVSKGAFCIDMMRTVGYDVVTIGNHDLDYGLPRLLELKDSLSNAVMVCANLYDANNHRCLMPFTISHISGYRVAFIGVLTTATEQLEANVVYDHTGQRKCHFGADSLVNIVQQTIDVAKLAHPDWIILLTHMGVDPLGKHMASWQLLEQLHDVDVLIDGHSHSVVNTKIPLPNIDKQVAVAQTGSGMTNVGCITLQRGQEPRVQLYAYQNLPQSEQVVAAYHEVVGKMQPILGKVVGYAPFELQHAIGGERVVRRQETNLGDLVADAYRQQLGTDIGWVNGGGLRTGIAMGDITYGQVLSVSPFNNFMCVAQVDGQQLADALEECYSKCPADLGSFAHISGIRCVVDTTIRNKLVWSEDNRLTVHGKRRVSQIQVLRNKKWVPVRKNDKLTIASSDYVVYEGESRALKHAIILRDKVTTDTDCLQRYIVEVLGGNIPQEYEHSQNRIHIK